MTSQALRANETEKWVDFRALRGASRWVRFFEHRCEKVLQQLAEQNPETLMNIFWLYSARTNVDPGLKCYKFHLYPEPGVPVQFLYTTAEPGIPASLSIRFSRSVEGDLPAKALYFMVCGLVEMIMRTLQKHGNAF
jgi:hypothetical protein